MAATALLLVLGVAIFADVAKSAVSPADGVVSASWLFNKVVNF